MVGGDTVFVSAEQYVLPSMIAAVIGGTSLTGGKGTNAGTAAGAAFLTLLTAMVKATSLSPADRQIAFGIVLIIFMSAYGRERA